MRVLFTQSNGDLYGASRSLLRLASRLVADGHGVLAVLRDDGPLRTALEDAGVQVTIDHSLSVIDRKAFASWTGILRLALGMPRSVYRIRRTAMAFGADIVHTNSSVMPTPGIAAALCRKPHVWHIREMYAEFPAFWRVYRRLMVRFSTTVVCVSRAVAEQFGGISRDGSVVVINNGLPADEFAAVEASRIESFRSVHQVGDRVLVGVVGRIKLRRKGQETFLAAAAVLKDKHPRAAFAVIGSPFPGNEQHLEQLERQIMESGLEGIAFCTGEAQDIKAAIAALDIMVLPSGLPEPFAGVVLEAMAFSKPVVGTRHGGTPEQVEDGRSGILVSPNDPRELAEALDRLIPDRELRLRMGEAGRQRYLDRFEFETAYGHVMDLYRKLTSPKMDSAETE